MALPLEFVRVDICSIIFNNDKFTENIRVVLHLVHNAVFIFLDEPTTNLKFITQKGCPLIKSLTV